MKAEQVTKVKLPVKVLVTESGDETFSNSKSEDGNKVWINEGKGIAFINVVLLLLD